MFTVINYLFITPIAMAQANPTVIIIGAGASGIACGTRLLQKGCRNLTVLEAEERIGGRIHTIEFGDNVVDLGGQWCHGETDNVVYDLAKPLNILQSSVYNFTTSTVFFDSNGKIVPFAITHRMHTLLNEIADDEDNEMATFDGSMGEFILDRFEKHIKSEFADTNPDVRKMLLEWFHKVQNSIDGSDSWFKTSAKGFSHYVDCPGDPLLNWGTKGYKTILDILMNKLPNPAKTIPLQDHILFNKDVISIRWNNEQENKATVVCGDGSKYTADHVIVTVSLGVLKDRLSTLFVPELPSYKQAAVNGLGIGTVNKLIFKFPHRWWPRGEDGFSLGWYETTKGIGELQKELDGSVESNIWLRDILGFYSVDEQPSILLGWIVNDGARKMELIPNDEVKDKVMKLLRFFVGKHYNIPEPEDFVRSMWSSNPHFCGSYSFRSMQTEEMNTSAAELARPLKNTNNHEVVFFAGEATHDRYYSTVHGAIASGWREADRVHKLFKTQRRKVVILGGGIAGLSAANKFLAEGIQDVTILEAQSSPGGRIQSLPFNNAFIEAGAQWIHGNNNALWEFADRSNLIAKETSEEGRGIYVRNDGYVFDKMLVAQIDIVVGNILHNCEEFFYGSKERIPTSVGEFLGYKFEEYLKSCVNDDAELIRKKREIFNWHVRFQVIDNSCLDLRQLSARMWGSYSCSSDHGQEHMNCSHGYSSVIDALCNRLPEDVLQLNHAVVEVIWDNESGVFIRCANGTGFQADFLLCTASIGVLKSCHKKLFQPNLPYEMQEVIEKMGFAGINKIFLEFHSKWWDVEGFQLIWKQDMVFREAPWLQYMSGFDEVLQHENVLLGWVGGVGAMMVEKVPETEIGRHCVKLLSTITGRQVPQPKRVVRTKWISNPYICGGYSHVTPACDAANLRPTLLNEPVLRADGRAVLAFAGEACHESHFSTTHGAFESGESQAKVVVELLRKYATPLPEIGMSHMSNQC